MYCTYLTGGCGIINPVPTDFTTVCVMTYTAVLVIQDGLTALDRAREGKYENADKDDEAEHDEVVKYLEEVGK